MRVWPAICTRGVRSRLKAVDAEIVYQAQQLQAKNFVIPRYQPLNLIQDRKGIERAEPRFEVVCRQPNRMTIGLA